MCMATQMDCSDWTLFARMSGRWVSAADTKAGSKAETLWQLNPIDRNQDDPSETGAGYEAKPDA